jgi:hypothetical protein
MWGAAGGLGLPDYPALAKVSASSEQHPLVNLRPFDLVDIAGLCRVGNELKCYKRKAKNKQTNKKKPFRYFMPCSFIL